MAKGTQATPCKIVQRSKGSVYPCRVNFGWKSTSCDRGSLRNIYAVLDTAWDGIAASENSEKYEFQESCDDIQKIFVIARYKVNHDLVIPVMAVEALKNHTISFGCCNSMAKAHIHLAAVLENIGNTGASLAYHRFSPTSTLLSISIKYTHKYYDSTP
ncbi:hypothetical protein BDZ97DRAFT_572368 [Flammula alnicola]|nr:hypothetical protein BDZ97DRAFT_572368 [Flammula alnicola]